MDYSFPGGSIADEDEAENLFPNFLMADSQISNLDISSPEPDEEQPNELAPCRTRSTTATTTTNTNTDTINTHSNRCGSSSSNSNINSNSSNPSTRNHPHPEPPGHQPWEADAVSVEARHQLPAHPDESQQDLAERLNHMTRTVDSYVVRPCRRVPGILKTYCPGVRDGLRDGLGALAAYEGQLRRAVANHVRGREMARLQGLLLAGGGAGPAAARGREGEEVSRLKDRLVEQDALLWDSNQHVVRLMRERDALRKRLEKTTTTTTTMKKRCDNPVTEGDLLGLDNSETGGSQPAETPDVHDSDDNDETRTGEKEVAVPVDQLRELRVLIDQISIREASKQERRKPNTNKDSHGDASDGNDEEPEWTML